MRRRPRNLSPEEKALWDDVRKSAQPLRPDHTKPSGELQSKRPKPITTAAPKPPRPDLNGFKIGAKTAQPARSHDLSPEIGAQVAAMSVAMDGKTHRKMTKGKLSPEARIDLHGMTMAQAHPALQRFILNAQGEGRRLVLVITGKGKHRDEGGPIPVRHGVLKHQVPHWLTSAPLRAVVLQISEAHLKHGGKGAYYVYLRRHR